VIKISRVLLLVTVQLLALQHPPKRKKIIQPTSTHLLGPAAMATPIPGAVMPFGMVQLSPDTRLEGWDGCSGYHYTDTCGLWLLAYPLKRHRHCRLLRYLVHAYHRPRHSLKTPLTARHLRRKTKLASPGYYKTRLDKYDIGVELTATTRAGMHRYELPFGAGGKYYNRPATSRPGFELVDRNY
jgi:putative alpha-1,2-mannosidase